MDRGFANDSWFRLFHSPIVRVLNTSSSDHLPIFLNIYGGSTGARGKRFRFENSWLLYSDCQRIVHRSWEEHQSLPLVDKLLFCGKYLSSWGSNLIRNFKFELNSCSYKIQILHSRTDAQGLKEFHNAQHMYNELLEKQESFWRQRARQFWLRDGDSNT